MEAKTFTLDYFGKPVSCVQEGEVYIVQISYAPVHLQKVGAQWIDKAQGRESDLSKQLGHLIEEQHLQK